MIELAKFMLCEFISTEKDYKAFRKPHEQNHYYLGIEYTAIKGWERTVKI